MDDDFHRDAGLDLEDLAEQGDGHGFVFGLNAYDNDTLRCRREEVSTPSTKPSNSVAASQFRTDFCVISSKRRYTFRQALRRSNDRPKATLESVAITLM